MISIRRISISWVVVFGLFLFSLYEGAIYIIGKEPEIYLGLGIFSLELSMLLIDIVYPHIFLGSMPDFSSPLERVVLIATALAILIIILMIFKIIFNRIKSICVGDYMLKKELRRVKSVLVFLIPLEILRLLDTVCWIVFEKGIFVFLGENSETIIWNTISVISSILYILLFVFTIKYINNFREAKNWEEKSNLS